VATLVASKRLRSSLWRPHDLALVLQRRPAPANTYRSFLLARSWLVLRCANVYNTPAAPHAYEIARRYGTTRGRRGRQGRRTARRRRRPSMRR